MNISVLIPVYNVEKYIIRCLESIANQTMTEGVQCVIVDDCVTDNSMLLVNKFIEDYKGNIQFEIIHHSKNTGIATARNSALNKASGDYVIMIDSDDYCEHNMLATFYKVAKDTDADIIVSDFWYTYKKYEVYTTQVVATTKEEMVRDLLEHRLFTVNWNKFIKRSLFVDNNITYLDGVNYGEDMKVCFSLIFAANKIVHVGKAFVHYVQYNESAYNHNLSKKSLEDYVIVLSSVTDCIKEHGYYDKCKNAVLDKQLSVKNLLLMHSKGQLQKRWNKLFPECNKRLLRVKMSRYWKLALLFANMGCLPLYNLIRNIWIRRSNKGFSIYTN